MKNVALVLTVLAIISGLFAVVALFRGGGIPKIVETITPTNKEIVNLLPQGKDTKSPFTLPDGLRIGIFADLGSGKPRVLAEDPNGVIVASITNLGKITALPDRNGDGIADSTIDILTGLSSPHGIVFNDNYLYVAETNKVVRYVYNAELFKVGPREELFSLPSNVGHFTRTIEINGGKLFTSVGSSCNVCEESDWQRASLLVSDLAGRGLHTLAKGLRNTVFFTFDSEGAIWGNDMGRDNLGDNLPPDELNMIDSAFAKSLDYGWPYCYGSKIYDKNFGRKNENYCSETIAPKYEYQAHTAPLGIAFIDSDLFASSEQGDLLVAYHGSWNSSVPVGYKIVKLDVAHGSIVGSEDLITGFVQGGDVLGRPVDLMFDKSGYLYVTDDKSGLIYIVSRS